MIAKHLNGIKVAAFRNAARLFRDACIVLTNGSHETSYALAILAYEEVGKVALADRQLDHICLNPGSEEYVAKHFAELSKKHITKQGWAAYDSGSSNPKKFSNLDAKKQSAIYTDITNNGITVPSVKKEVAIEMIQEVYRALNDLGDVAYNGIDGFSTAKSEWQHNADLLELKELYESAINGS